VSPARRINALSSWEVAMGLFNPRVDYASPYRPATGDFNRDVTVKIAFASNPLICSLEHDRAK
jgi:hypothetical protein